MSNSTFESISGLLNEDFLKTLVGLEVAAAEEAVRKNGLEPWVSNTKTIRPSMTYPKNVVDLIVDENNMVVKAVNQQSIDQRHNDPMMG